MAATCAAFETELLAVQGDPTNYIPNPNLEIDLASWTPTQSPGLGAFANARDTSWASRGSASLHMTATNGTTGTGRGSYMRSPIGVSGAPTAPGQVWTMSAICNLVSGGIAGNTAGARAALWWWQSGGGPSAVLAQNYTFPYQTDLGVSPIRVSAPAPSDAAFVSGGAFLFFQTTAPTNAQLDAYFDQLMLAPNAEWPYIDGEMPGCVWTGAASNSITKSLVGYPNPAKGLMQGANQRLRDAYQRGIADPLAHQIAKANPDAVAALYDNSKLASFDAITAP